MILRGVIFRWMRTLFKGSRHGIGENDVEEVLSR
jgi:hypothetical protein